MTSGEHIVTVEHENGAALEYRLDDFGKVHWRIPVHVRGDTFRWVREWDKDKLALVRALSAMESRANEYHDTTMQQARRIAELEHETNALRARLAEAEADRDNWMEQASTAGPPLSE